MARKTAIVLTAEYPTEVGLSYLIAGLFHQSQSTVLVVPVIGEQIQVLLQKHLNFIGTDFTQMTVASFLDSDLAPKWLKERAEQLDGVTQDAQLLQAYEMAFEQKPNAGTVSADRQVCVGVGQDGLRSALKYALLTHRAVFHVPDYDDLNDDWFCQMSSASSLLMFPNDTFSIEHLHRMMAAKAQGAPECLIGYAYPFGKEQRELMRLKMVVAMSCEPPTNRAVHTLLPLSARKPSVEVGQYRLSTGYGDANTSEWLQQPSQALITMPHSNGVNMSLGQTVLCAKKHREVDSAASAVHPCFKSALCNREKPGVVPLSPVELPASLVMSYTCWGAVLSGGVYDTRYTLAAQFALSPYTSVLITTYTTIKLDPQAPVHFLQAYESGERVGEIVATFNRNHYASYKDVLSALMVFGDPEYVKAGSANKKDLDRAVDLVKEVLQVDQDKDRPYTAHSFSTAYLDYSRAVSQLSRGIAVREISTSSVALQQATETYWGAAKCLAARSISSQKKNASDVKAIEHYTGKMLDNFHSAWCEFYLAMLHHLGGYLRLQTDKVYVPADLRSKTSTCPYCEGTLSVNPMHLANESSQARVLHECPNCATVLDAVGHFSSAQVNGESHCSIQSPYELSLALEFEQAKSDKTSLTCLAVIEPFIKGGKGELAMSKMHTTLDKHSHNYHVGLPHISLPAHYVCGLHTLNVLVLLEDEVALIRRTIYLTE
ncbi:hypothetical protein ACFFUP_01730 [Vibrio ostreicida]|uniref:Uncharacterized protein n=1 Tax=Vibrio ostreicida TaxID=526588 RepID=A0ABT8BWE7_9VIBR|nr:hypothetical protein [Vibrio ostreicida]MDN3610403.1 hypothetical protein [Vibrio ostreicida]NPD07587.1 hypothetical protein [Vibrio ostreicida]